MYAFWGLALAGLLAAGTSVALPAPSQGATLPAPYQVGGIERRLPDRDVEGGSLQLGATTVLVDLDDADRMPLPDRDELARATIVGSTGIAVAYLVDIERRCEFLCGHEPASCRHVALYSGIDLQQVGTPLLALPGSLSLSEHTPVAPAPRPAARPSPESPPTSQSGAELAALRRLLDRDAVFVRPIWSTYPDDPTAYRLVPSPSAPAAMALQTRAWDRTESSTPARGCDYQLVGGIGSLDCDSFALLLDGARPLLVSLPDYNLDVAEVIASFAHDGVTYRVIRLGLKAQTVFGLLLETEEGWLARIRPRTFDLLCPP